MGSKLPKIVVLRKQRVYPEALGAHMALRTRGKAGSAMLWLGLLEASDHLPVPYSVD